MDIIAKFETIFKNIKEEKRSNFYLFMVLKMDEFTDKWSVVISAPWNTAQNQHETFQYIARKITEVLTPEETSTIARIGTFLPDEHLVVLINQAFKIKDDSPVRIENKKVNGFQVHEAYIFESLPPTELNSNHL